ncbi:hypothetical protein Ade02nite_80490 [Paractinoplanes deccanensis]|uniref:Uncharacterized protein n=1 Tax=Paractinoplanes deccanensis TaxID=113561 RepID=A0ABQ3YHD3_9ACTN|nr:hypothetical protein [Actinoplanes deccanensis]GID79408.1 hypothetical protein Ade02nite_80490 [Actinoplanes deccanensis]
MAHAFEEWAHLPSPDTDLAVPSIPLLYAATAALAAAVTVTAATVHYWRARRARVTTARSR